MTVLQNGNVGIGELNPAVPLNFASTLGDKISLWGTSGNHFGFGIQPSLIQIHAANAGDDIAFGYGSSASFSETMRIKGNGNVGIGTASPANKLDVNGNASFNGTASVFGNLSVQNGKGIIRSANGTQQKKLVIIVNVSGNFSAGQTRSFAFSWPETFGAAPDAYVGAVAPGSSGGWAEMVMSVAADNTTGGTLFVHNPNQSASITPNFNIKIIAIGPQ